MRGTAHFLQPVSYDWQWRDGMLLNSHAELRNRVSLARLRIAVNYTGLCRYAQNTSGPNLGRTTAPGQATHRHGLVPRKPELEAALVRGIISALPIGREPRLPGWPRNLYLNTPISAIPALVGGHVA